MATKVLRAEVIKGEVYINRADLVELIKERGLNYLSSTALTLCIEMAEALEAGTPLMGEKLKPETKSGKGWLPVDEKGKTL